MQDPPSSAVILKLAEQSQAVLGGGQFELRMTAAALDLVKRADVLAPEYDAAECKRLSALLGEDGGLEQLNRKLCDLIRDGAVDLRSAPLAAHLRATTMEKLAIDQPTYAAYKRALSIKQG